MVRNPIYEAGAIYDEIPANFPPPIPPDRDESYVTIAANNPKNGGNLQVCGYYNQLVHWCSYNGYSASV